MDPIVISYRIDEADRLIAVGGGWDQFASENDGAGAQPEAVLGRSLWDFVTGPTLRELYRRLMKEVRSGRPVRFRCRCDAPAQRRVFLISIDPLPSGQVEYTTLLTAIERREAVTWLDAQQPRSSDLVCVCSWCGRVRLPEGSWVAIEEAMERYEDLHGPAVPGLTHGICEYCLTQMVGQLGETPGGDRPLNELPQ